MLESMTVLLCLLWYVISLHTFTLARWFANTEDNPQICCLVALYFNGLQISQGFGKHVVHLTLQQQIGVRKWNFALEMPLLLGTALSKISISLLLLRLLGKASSRTQKIILHSINFFVAAYTFVDIINNVIACKPTAKLWDLELPGKCRSTSSIIAITYFQGGWKPCRSCQV